MNEHIKATVIDGKPKPRANYPHIKRAGDFLYISGTSSRRADNSFAGVEVDELGTVNLDIRLQTRAVIENIQSTLQRVDAGLADLVELSCFLVNMNDFGGFNEVTTNTLITMVLLEPPLPCINFLILTCWLR